jgi:hypothetical protein
MHFHNLFFISQGVLGVNLISKGMRDTVDRFYFQRVHGPKIEILGGLHHQKLFVLFGRHSIDLVSEGLKWVPGPLVDQLGARQGCHNLHPPLPPG